VNSCPINRENVPYCTCKDTFFENNHEDCGNCVFPCVNCLSLSDCTSCVDDPNREDATLDCVCKAGHFEDE